MHLRNLWLRHPNSKDADLLKHFADTKQKVKFVNKVWSDEDKEKFVEALKMYGKDWSKIKLHLENKTLNQIYA